MFKRKPKTAKTPLWAQKFIENGTVPERGTSEHFQFVNWLYFDDSMSFVPGLGRPEDHEEKIQAWYHSEA
jgi:hypothetical protein